VNLGVDLGVGFAGKPKRWEMKRGRDEEIKTLLGF